MFVRRQTLFRADSLAYKIKPVMGYDNLLSANKQLNALERNEVAQ
jgi:hypothetical protein